MITISEVLAYAFVQKQYRGFDCINQHKRKFV